MRAVALSCPSLTRIGYVDPWPNPFVRQPIRVILLPRVKSLRLASFTGSTWPSLVATARAGHFANLVGLELADCLGLPDVETSEKLHKCSTNSWRTCCA